MYTTHTLLDTFNNEGDQDKEFSPENVSPNFDFHDKKGDSPQMTLCLTFIQSFPSHY